jgi:hypothetical protein
MLLWVPRVSAATGEKKNAVLLEVKVKPHGGMIPGESGSRGCTPDYEACVLGMTFAA